MKRRLALLTGAGVLAWVLGLVVHLPATRAVPWFAPEGIQAAGVSGTLWRGRADRVDTAGPATITGVEWELAGLHLLRGQLAADTRFRLAGLEGHGYLTTGPGDRIEVEGLALRGSAAGIGPLLPQLAVGLDGQLLMRLEEAALADGRIERLHGRLQWSEARVTTPFDLDLGRVRATVAPAVEGADYAVELTGEGGGLDIAGEVDLQRDGRYRADLLLTPTATAPDGLRETLDFAAQREGDGFRLRRGGRLALPRGE